MYKGKLYQTRRNESANSKEVRYGANTAWKAALGQAGIDDFRFHDLQTHLSRLAGSAGVPLSVAEMSWSLSKWFVDMPTLQLNQSYRTRTANRPPILKPIVPNLSQSKIRKVSNM